MSESMLLCVQQMQLPWAPDRLALELLLLMLVLLCVQQMQLPWAPDRLALELLLLKFIRRRTK